MKAMTTSLLLTAILALFAQCGQASVDGMISYWRFDEPAGDIVFDSFGNNHGTIENDPQRISGIVGGAVSFDGVWDGDGPRDCVRIYSPSGIPIGNSPWSLSLWININEYPPDTHIGFLFDRGDSSGGSYRKMHRLAMGWLVPGHYPEPRGRLWNCFWGVPFDYDTGVDIDLDTWYHITNTYDGSTARIYVDGVERWSKIIGSPLDVRSSDIWLGGHGSHLSAGIIDEVAIYDRALSPAEIQQHYEDGLNGLGYLATLVEIDIKPGSYPNAINLGSHGLIPVAILSSDYFDATSVDPDTVALAGAGVEVRGKSNKYMAHVEDVNADGLIDLVVQVATENLEPGSFQDGYAILTGTTYDGLDIEGSDEITIVPQ